MIRVRSLTLAIALAALPATAFAGTVVPLPHFDGVGLRGGGHVVIRHGATQSVTILKGSTQYTTLKVEDGGGLSIEACNSNCPSNYDLQIEITTPTVDAVAIQGGGSIETAGAFPATSNINVAVSGGGDIDVTSVQANSVKAAVSGGGSIKVNVKASLIAAVNGGGDISYRGNPQVTQAVNGGGSVEHTGS